MWGLEMPISSIQLNSHCLARFRIGPVYQLNVWSGAVSNKTLKQDGRDGSVVG